VLNLTGGLGDAAGAAGAGGRCTRDPIRDWRHLAAAVDTRAVTIFAPRRSGSRLPVRQSRPCRQAGQALLAVPLCIRTRTPYPKMKCRKPFCIFGGDGGAGDAGKWRAALILVPGSFLGCRRSVAATACVASVAAKRRRRRRSYSAGVLLDDRGRLSIPTPSHPDPLPEGEGENALTLATQTNFFTAIKYAICIAAIVFVILALEEEPPRFRLEQFSPRIFSPCSSRRSASPR